MLPAPFPPEERPTLVPDVSGFLPERCPGQVCETTSKLQTRKSRPHTTPPSHVPATPSRSSALCQIIVLPWFWSVIPVENFQDFPPSSENDWFSKGGIRVGLRPNKIELRDGILPLGTGLVPFVKLARVHP